MIGYLHSKTDGLLTVNKDWMCKEKDIDQAYKDHNKDKDLTHKDKDFTYKDLQLNLNMHNERLWFKARQSKMIFKSSSIQ